MSIQIVPLSEGVFTIGHDKLFHPFDTAKHQLSERASGSLLVEIQPFLIQTKGKNILCDTGLGFINETGEMQLHAKLLSHGLFPGDIHMVLLSHLHKDHAGGILYKNRLGITELSFPNATYYVSKQEFNYGMQQGAPSYMTEHFDLLQNSRQVEWLDTKGTIQQFITYETDGGHCPFHTSFRIHSDSEQVFFGGDVAPQMRQLQTRYIAKYDFDGRRTMELRQQYAHIGKVEHWTFLFYHDINLPFSKM